MAKDEDRARDDVTGNAQPKDAPRTGASDKADKKGSAKDDPKSVAKGKEPRGKTIPEARPNVGKDMENPHGNEGEGSTSAAKQYGDELKEYKKTHDPDADAREAAKDLDDEAGGAARSGKPAKPGTKTKK